MKVILVANTGWYLYNFRLSLAHRLASEGAQVIMVSPEDEYAPTIRAAGFETLPWKLERQAGAPWQEFRSIFDLQRIYKHEKPDLVHHFTIKPVIYGSIAARLARIPAVINSITGRGFVFLDSSEKAAYLRPFVRALFRLGYRRLQAATTFENQSDLEFFINSGMVPPGNTHLVNGVGVDTQAFDYQPELQNNPPLIVFPGRLIWAKGVGTLVECAQLLKKRLPVRIVLVGKPDPGNPESIDQDTIAQWARQGLVEWWGWQSNMSAVYHKANVIVLPSMGEGLSKALLEAAACGRPIVSTDVPGCREVVIPGVTGYLVPTRDSQALADRLEKLLRDPELRQQMGLSGRRLVEENYSDEIVCNQLFEIYRQVLPGALTRSPADIPLPQETGSGE